MTPRESITKSSIPGGLFAGQPDVENLAPPGRRALPRRDAAQHHVAGFKPKESQGLPEPLGSVRSDHNRSSVEGGIFGMNSVPMGARPPSARADPNRSSVQGGIFG